MNPVEISDLIPKQDWVVFQYDNNPYPGEVQDVNPQNEVIVKVMHLAKSGAYYFRLKEDDCISYYQDNIIKKIEAPIPCGGQENTTGFYQQFLTLSELLLSDLKLMKENLIFEF